MAVANETVGLYDVEKQYRCITICNFCKGTLTSPKILPCFHSFCLICLNENTILNLQSGTTPKCPTCRADILSQVGSTTNEFIDSIIATADVLSPILHVTGFQRTNGSASRPTAELSDPAYRRQDTGRGKSPRQIGRRIKNLVKPVRVSHEDRPSRQGCTSDNPQRMTVCKTHRQKFDRYCSNCRQVICKLYSKSEHCNHRMISVDLAWKDLRQMIKSYAIAVESCQACYRAQNNISEAAREGRNSAATINRMANTPVSRGCLKSGRYEHALPASPLISTSLETWKEYTRRFYEEIKTKSLSSDMLNISNKLRKLHETWHHEYEDEGSAQQSQNKNSPYSRVHASTEQEMKHLDLKMERDRSAGELQTVGLSPRNHTRNDSSVTQQRLYYVNEQQRQLDQMREKEEYYTKEKATWERKETKFMDEIERLKGQKYALSKENDYLTTMYINEQQSHERSKRQLSEHLKKKFEWMQEKELCINSHKEFKSEKGKLEGELLEQQKSNADIQKKLTEQFQKSKRLRRELEQLIYWIKNEHPEEFQTTTTECDSDISIIKRVKVSIVEKTKERSEKERHLLDRNEELNHQMEELKSRVLSELRAHQLKSSDFAKKEHACLIREKQYADKIHYLERQIDHLKEKLESNKTAQKELTTELSSKIAESTDLKQRIGQFLADRRKEDARHTCLGPLQELEKLLKWIERGDRHTLEEQMTNERESENSIITKIKESIIVTTKELRDKERQLSKTIEEMSHQLHELKMSLSSEKTNQQKSVIKFERERDKLITKIDSLKNSESQLNAIIQELESKIHYLENALGHQIETSQEKLKTRSMKNGNETNMKQQLEYSIADNDQLSSTGAELSVEATKLKQQHSNTKIGEFFL